MCKTAAFAFLGFLVLSACAGKNVTINSELFRAAVKGDATRVSECLDKGANAGVTDPDDPGINPDSEPATALEAAIKAGSLACAELLYKKGARLKKGSEALHALILSPDPDIELVRLIIRQKEMVNAKDLGGDTPLNHAVRIGAMDLVSVLAAEGGIYTDSSGKVQNIKRAFSDAEKNAVDNPLCFAGVYTGGYLGFEGSGYYFSLKDREGKTKVFRSEANPEIAFFVISDETGMPSQNRELIGNTFKVYYRRGTETDVRGESVPVNIYIHSEVENR